MAGGAAQRIKINTLFLKSRMFPDIPAVTSATGFGLGFFIVHHIGFSMQSVTPRTIDGGPVMCAAYKHGSFLTHAFIRMTGQAGMQLLFPG